MVFLEGLYYILIDIIYTYEPFLIAALQAYTLPSPKKPSDRPKRFPMRNRFMSEYIYEATGKKRTPKQVGSRIQQLQDTCKTPERLLACVLRLRSHQFTFFAVLKLLRHRRVTSIDESEPLRVSSQHGHPQIPSPTHPIYNSSHRFIDVQIVLDGISAQSRPIIPVALSSVPLASLQIRLANSDFESASFPLFYGGLSGRNPMLEIHSSHQMAHQTSFYVFYDGSPKPIHHEVGILKLRPSPPSVREWMYNSSLVPLLWDSLSKVDG